MTEKGHKGFLEAICLLRPVKTEELNWKDEQFPEKAYAGIGLHLISSKRGMKTMMINSSLFWNLAIFQFTKVLELIVPPEEAKPRFAFLYILWVTWAVENNNSHGYL